MNNERCISTTSTVSGIHSHILPVSYAITITSSLFRLLCNLNSQEPVCMFYFAHPFGGIATPASTSYSIDPYAGMPTAEQISNSRPKNSSSNQANQQHLNDFTPWPRQTLQPRDVLSPLIQALQKQIGKLQILPFKKKL